MHFPSPSLTRLIARLTFCLIASLAGNASEGPAPEPVVTLSPVKVLGESMEEFGFRVSPDFNYEASTKDRKIYVPVIDLVLPNSAASKAGLRPGDRILRSDRVFVGDGSPKLSSWRRIQKDKWKQILGGREQISWTLTLESAGSRTHRELTLSLPTPPPRWGRGQWKTPPEREAFTIAEAGMLSPRAKDILKCGAWTLLRGSYVKAFELPYNDEHPVFLGYQWTVWHKGIGHRMFVSTQRGRTDIILEVIFKASGSSVLFDAPKSQPDTSLLSATNVLAIDSVAYHTNPQAELLKAWRLPPDNRQKELPVEAARANFNAEVEFWRERIVNTTGPWPLGLSPE